MNADHPHESLPASMQGLEAALLASIVASSTDAIVSKTLDGIVTSWNAAASRIFGYAPDEMIGQHIIKLIPEDRSSEEDEIMRRLRLGERVEHFDTIRRAKDGHLIPVSLTISPMRDEQGRIFGASKIARDITERTRLQERQQLLMNELRHRVKNMLSTVGSIARQSFRGAEHASALARFSQRLSALAVSYDYLISEERSDANLGDVIEAVLSPFMSGGDRIAIERAANVKLTSAQATSIALAVNELATNAVKYGALSTNEGQIAVAWKTTDDGTAEVSWIERHGPRVQPPSHTGFGTQILKLALRHELKAETELDFAPEGFRFCMRFRPS